MEGIAVTHAPQVVELARFLVALTRDRIPEPILERGRGLIVDQVAVSLVGSRQSSYSALEALLHEQGIDSRGEALVLSATGRMTNAYAAAVLNAASAHIAELGEGVSRAVVHASNAVVPAALAEAAALGLPGSDLLTAVTLACETIIRFGLVVNGPLPDTRVEGDAAEAYLSGWWTPTLLAPIGAATAVVLLHGGSAGQLIRAWSIALNTAPATTTRFVHDGAAGKGYAMGVACGGGLIAAKLSLAESVDEGEAPLVAHWPSMLVDSPRTGYLNRDLGHAWELDFPLYKFFASVGTIHAALEATLLIVGQHRIDPKRIAGVRVEGYARSVSFKGNARPRSAEEAKASLVHHIAVALVLQRRDVFLHEAFCEPIMTDPVVNAVAGRVTAAVNDEFNAEYPFRSARARVTVEMDGGEVYAQEVDRDRMSKYHHPTRDALSAKFVDATAFIVSPAGQQAALEALWTLEKAGNVGSVVGRFRHSWLYTEKENAL